MGGCVQSDPLRIHTNIRRLNQIYKWKWDNRRSNAGADLVASDVFSFDFSSVHWDAFNASEGTWSEQAVSMP